MTRADSTRFDGDSWDLASSVGLTATMVAAARAVASRASDGSNALVNDQFAAPLVRAVGVDFFSRMASGELDPRDLDEDAARNMRRFADAMAIRTKYFDEFFLDATRAGIRQAVILASGLDSRAYRLPWPAGTTVYEVDQPQVIEFKTSTLAGLGAEPTADRRAVAIDLRDDWPAALQRAGFDPTQRTAWIAEGLLGYLPAEAQDRLLDQVTALSVPGSLFATEGLLEINELNEQELRRRMRRQSEMWDSHGFELDMGGLVYFDERTDTRTYLSNHGWRISDTNTKDLVAQHGLPPIDDDDLVFGEIVYVAAKLKEPEAELH
jgi:methyltransferase (TIGR00027 family)